jgi:hypothetical protein
MSETKILYTVPLSGWLNRIEWTHQNRYAMRLHFLTFPDKQFRRSNAFMCWYVWVSRPFQVTFAVKLKDFFTISGIWATDLSQTWLCTYMSYIEVFSLVFEATQYWWWPYKGYLSCRIWFMWLRGESYWYYHCHRKGKTQGVKRSDLNSWSVHTDLLLQQWLMSHSYQI